MFSVCFLFQLQICVQRQVAGKDTCPSISLSHSPFGMVLAVFPPYLQSAVKGRRHEFPMSLHWLFDVNLSCSQSLFPGVRKSNLFHWEPLCLCHRVFPAGSILPFFCSENPSWQSMRHFLSLVYGKPWRFLKEKMGRVFKFCGEPAFICRIKTYNPDWLNRYLTSIIILSRDTS